MARVKYAFEKPGLSFITGAALLVTSLSAQAGLFSTEWNEELRRADEPAMRNIVPMLTLNDIRDIMIKESIAKNGYCACPYSTDALGGQCGSLSAYYYPWKKILCYRRDISSDEVEFFRIDRALVNYEAQENKQYTAQEPAGPEKPKKDPTVDYFRNSAKPIPRTNFAPPNFGASSGSSNNYQSDVQSNINLPYTTNTGGYNNLTVPSTYVSPLK